MKLHIFTIVLDGQPFVAWQWPVLQSLRCDWHWYIAEGAAQNVKDTSWCKPQSPRLSRDGTTEFLNAIRNHPRVTIIQKQSWDGKVEQCNACLAQMKEPGVLLQMDVDEFWTAEQLMFIVGAMRTGKWINGMRFFCRYFVGANIVTIGEDSYGNNPGEWERVWRFTPGDHFKKHEPPTLYQQSPGQTMSRDTTRENWLVFDHFAYVLPKQLTFKESYYGYRGALAQWQRLQTNTTWPVKLKTFLPWVDEKATADLLHKP